VIAALVPLLFLASAAGRVTEAERLAEGAARLAAERAPAAVAQARKALDLTEEFDPTAFVSMGRKGEVVEDAYQQARLDYRRHRARLYAAMGESLAAAGQLRPATRYLGRAALLDPVADRSRRYAAALLAESRGREALDVLRRLPAAGGLGPEAVELIERAADLVGLPSVQAEIDRARLQPLGATVEFRDGPFKLGEAARLSTGSPYRIEGELTVFYMATTACATCSQDLEALRKVLPPGARVVLVAEDPERDQALRQILTLYRYEWPLLLGRGHYKSLGAPGGTALVVARGGWVGAVVRPPLLTTLPPVLAALGRTEVRETVPRPGWNSRPPDRAPVAGPPALLPEGLAPGEDLPLPGPFTAAADAHREGKHLEALRFLQALAAKDDGWLLSPEERYDRALFLSGLGRKEEARKLMLGIGDSRFQAEVDRALERVGR
jgi:tetratricopeptide (TPR) repeat protein